MAFSLFKRKEKTTQALSRTRNGWGGGLRSIFGTSVSIDDPVWEKLEESLISADVGVSTSLQLVDRVRQRVRGESISDPETVVGICKQEIAALINIADANKWDWYNESSFPADTPVVVMLIGVNGAGKTTTAAKLICHYQELGKSVLLGAGDTFRAAAIDQLRIWGSRAGVDTVAHQIGSDPGAVAFDAYQAAISRGVDVLVFDTAGRLHNKSQLVEELRKISRVFERLNPDAPHQILLVMDATTGQNGVQQARVFKESVGISGVFLAKLDGTAKGGVSVAIAQELNLPVLFIGTGEEPEDYSVFDTDDFVESLFGDKDDPA